MTNPDKSGLSGNEQLFLFSPPANVSKTTLSDPEPLRRWNMVLCCGFNIPTLFQNELSTSKKLNISAHASLLFLFELVEISIRRASARYYRLCCTLNPLDQNKPLSLAASKASELPLNLRCFVSDPEEADRDKTFNVKDVYLNELNSKIPFADESGNPVLPWRSTVMLEKSETSHSINMVFSFSHVLGDGLSLALFSKSLMEELDFVIRKDQELAKLQVEFLSIQHPHDWDVELIGLKPPDYTGLPSMKTELKSFLAMIVLYIYFTWNSIKKLVHNLYCPQFKVLLNKESQVLAEEENTAESPTVSRHRSWSINHENMDAYRIDASKLVSMGHFPLKSTIPSTNNQGTNVAYIFSLDKDNTNQLRKAARVHGTTVTGMVLAALAIAYKREYSWYSQSKDKSIDYLSWACTANLRYLLDSNDQYSFGNYSTMGWAYNAALNIPNEFHGPEFWSLACRMLAESKKMMQLMTYAFGAFSFFVAKLLQMQGKDWSNSFLGSVLAKRFAEKFRRPPFIPFIYTNLGNAYTALFHDRSDERIYNNEFVKFEEAYGALNADAGGSPFQYCVTTVTDIHGVLHVTITANSTFTCEKRLRYFGEVLENGLSELLLNN